jgi:hypothetical protein
MTNNTAGIFGTMRLFALVFFGFLIRKLKMSNTNMQNVHKHLSKMPVTFCLNENNAKNSFMQNLPAIKKLFPTKSRFEK